MADYTGPVVFVEGVHYPATVIEHIEDEEDRTHADLTRPLRVNPDGTYRDALPEEELHNDMNHQNEVEMYPGSEDDE